MTLFLIGAAAVLSYWIGKERTEIKYQRRLIDTEARAKYWCEIASRQRQKPEGPPIVVPEPPELKSET